MSEERDVCVCVCYIKKKKEEKKKLICGNNYAARKEIKWRRRRSDFVHLTLSMVSRSSLLNVLHGMSRWQRTCAVVSVGMVTLG